MTEKMTTRRLNDLGLGFMQSGTVVAAVELGLFDVLADGTLPVVEIADQIGLTGDRADKLISVAASLDLVVREGNKVASQAFSGGRGRVHSGADFASYLSDAGFTVDKVEEFLVGSMGWATGTKPAG